MRNREDANDALQNAMIKIFSKLDQFKIGVGSFKSWSCKIVVNECIMYQRKYWKFNINQELNDEILCYSHDEDPISALTTEEMIHMIQKLPAGYRVVFNLYVMEGYSHKEISEILDINIGTSKSQLFRAKQILKREIEASLNFEKYA